MDDLAIEAQVRHLGGTYVPRKGVTKEALSTGVNQLQSSIAGVIKVDEVRASDYASTTSTRPAMKLQNDRDRQGVDIFNWTHQKEDVSKNGKKKINGPAGHPEKDNGNILYWSTK